MDDIGELLAETRRMTRDTFVNLLVGGVLVALLTFVAGVQVGMKVERDRATCQEDMACWDCTTDGNGVCGRP